MMAETNVIMVRSVCDAGAQERLLGELNDLAGKLNTGEFRIDFTERKLPCCVVSRIAEGRIESIVVETDHASLILRSGSGAGYENPLRVGLSAADFAIGSDYRLRISNGPMPGPGALAALSGAIDGLYGDEEE
jgi:hypothetical protein